MKNLKLIIPEQAPEYTIVSSEEEGCIYIGKGEIGNKTAKLIQSIPDFWDACNDSLQLLEQNLQYRKANNLTVGDTFLESTIDKLKTVINKNK